MDSDDVYLELRRQLDFSKKVVERSEIYSKLTDQLTNNTAVKCSIARVLGSHNQLPMVIYELGSIQYSWPSRICLSLALLLKENSGGLIEGIEVFEPTATPVESRVIEDLGCSISLINEMCQRVDKPTLFFLQYPDRVLFEHLFEINWCPDRLSQMIVLGYSFKRMMERINTYISDQEEEGVTEQRNKLQRLIAIQKYVYEFNVCDKIKSMHRGELLIEEEWEQQCDDPPMCASEASGNNNAEMDFDREDNDGEEGRSNSEFDEYDEGIFYVMLSLHFFKLDPDTNMEALLPSTSSKGIIKLDQMKISHENPLRQNLIASCRSDDNLEPRTWVYQIPWEKTNSITNSV
ncbi:protein SENSITIVITY TO RED LIGHT REDUCED 1-like [Phoenix dactylifera]|uniref:Protein SENSITIVITY TO RED LIGHT REDUCED 1-like n=1 Tax=Phoenix dactylifera TaxID=42345 RepID=A0A8B8ZJL5_PHODC|nr:protein SENSITIVITY TO RED LIGHT REDUCED 1-like [Phoenix dactylifera]